MPADLPASPACPTCLTAQATPASPDADDPRPQPEEVLPGPSKTPIRREHSEPAGKPSADASEQGAQEQPPEGGSAKNSSSSTASSKDSEEWQDDELEPWKTDPYW